MKDSEKKTILLVDDDEHILLAIGDWLVLEGYDVVKASGGREALRVLAGTHPDLVLLDVMMPDMDGGDVAEEIRKNPLLSDIPLAFLTAAVSEQEVTSHGGVIGGDRYLSKSCEPDVLIKHIRDCFGDSV